MKEAGGDVCTSSLKGTLWGRRVYVSCWVENKGTRDHSDVALVGALWEYDDFKKGSELYGCVLPPRSLPLERKVAWGSMGRNSVGNSDVVGNSPHIAPWSHCLEAPSRPEVVSSSQSEAASSSSDPVLKQPSGLGQKHDQTALKQSRRPNSQGLNKQRPKTAPAA